MKYGKSSKIPSHMRRPKCWGTSLDTQSRMLQNFPTCRISHLSEQREMDNCPFWLRVLPRRWISGAGSTDRDSYKTRNYRNALRPKSRISGRDGKLSNSYRGNSGRDGEFRMMENDGDECNRAEADSSGDSSSDKRLFVLNNNPLMSLMSRIPYK